MNAVPSFARPALGRLLRAIPRTNALGQALIENDPIASYLREMATGADASKSMTALDTPSLSPVERIMLLDFTTYLPDDILAKVDRASMAVSLEVRTPFLDHRVVEFAWSLPLSMKIRSDRGKWIIRKLLRRYLPDTLVDREKKGFGLPLSQWLRGPLRAWAEELLARPYEPFDAAHVRDMWKRHLAGEDHGRDLWTVMMYQAWLPTGTPR